MQIFPHKPRGMDGWRERASGRRGGQAREAHSFPRPPPRDTPPLSLLLSRPTTHPATMEDNVPALTVETTPFDGQKPGTSGLRKKVSESAAGNGGSAR